MALQTVREILVDTIASTKRYSDARIIEALRANRQTVLIRNPLAIIANPTIWANLFFTIGAVPLNTSDYLDSLMKPEPGKRSFQAKPNLRNWDSLTPPTVYRYGVVQTITTDFTVNYPEGRITFTEDVQDYEPVEASFCYYRVYHAARQCLLSRLGTGRTLVSWTEQDGTSEHYGTVKEAIAAMDALIKGFSPSNIPFATRIY